jgi:hypothetical protein
VYLAFLIQGRWIIVKVVFPNWGKICVANKRISRRFLAISGGDVYLLLEVAQLVIISLILVLPSSVLALACVLTLLVNGRVNSNDEVMLANSAREVSVLYGLLSSFGLILTGGFISFLIKEQYLP